MSLNSDLNTLKTNIEGVKSTLYTNLTNKGVTNISETDTLSTLADKVSTITAGEGGSGFDFTQIGYDAEFSSELNDKMNSDIAYSKSLLDAWNPNNTSANGLYGNNKKIVYAPNIDTSNVIDMLNMFGRCSNLQIVPFYNTSNVTRMEEMFYGCTNLQAVKEFDTRNVNTMCNMFYNCSSIQTVPYFETSKVTSMEQMFYGCSNLKTIPSFNTINVKNMKYLFYNCSSLTSIPEIDTSQVDSIQYMLVGCSKLTTIEGISFKSYSASSMNASYLVGPISNSSIRKAVFKDIGYQSTAVQFNTKSISNWGVNTDEILDARQSLIDSLITYSFDRSAAGYDTCTITLSDNTKALLTEDEKAQITAKGFTIA